jgi:hypothetical protein
MLRENSMDIFNKEYLKLIFEEKNYDKNIKILRDRINKN